MAAGRRALASGVVFFIGLIEIATMARRPEFQMYRAVDITQLLASGMCFGAGLVLLCLAFAENIPSTPRRETVAYSSPGKAIWES